MGVPLGVPIIGIPLYLADTQLHAFEAEFGEGAESDQEIMMYLRHQTGHALNYAYQLYEMPEWRQHFGDYDKPYRDEYWPAPFSPDYVVHLPGWYAQKHPDEDFAETFAVWLTPGSNWDKSYGRSSAIRKLRFVEKIIGQIEQQAPRAQSMERDLDVSEIEETVEDFYRHRDLDCRVDLQIEDQLDPALRQLFDPPEEGKPLASTLIRLSQNLLIQSATRYSGVGRAVVKTLLGQLTDRTLSMSLTAPVERNDRYISELTALVCTLALNYLSTGRWFDPQLHS